MPIYDYKCTECEHEFAVLVQHHEPDTPIECPVCAGTTKFFLPMGKRNVKFLFNYFSPDV